MAIPEILFHLLSSCVVSKVKSKLTGEDEVLSGFSETALKEVVDGIKKKVNAEPTLEKRLATTLQQTFDDVDNDFDAQFSWAYPYLENAAIHSPEQLAEKLKEWRMHCHPLTRKPSDSDIKDFAEQFYSAFYAKIKEDEKLQHFLTAENTYSLVKEKSADIQKTVEREGEKTRELIRERFGEQKPPAAPAITLVTDSKPSPPSSIFEGRDDDLKQIREMAQGEKIVLVNGMGGIGKTEICRHLYDYYRNNPGADGVTHLGWLNYMDSLEGMFHLQFKNLPAATPKEYLKHVESYADELRGRLLLFIDNANTISDDDANYLCRFGCRMIMTSRNDEVGRFRVHSIDKLSVEECLELYKKYSGDRKPEHEEAIKAIITLADRHTQTLVLLAKTQKTTGISAQALLDELKSTGFSLQNITENIKAEHGDTTVEATFIEHLSIIFNVETVAPDEAQLAVLRWFSLLAPNLPLQKQTVKQWFGLDNLNAVNDLIARGWLNIDANNMVSIHPVISDVVRHKYHPDYRFAKILVFTLRNELKNSYEKGEGIAVWNVLTAHAAALAQRLEGTEKAEFAALLNNIGSVYRRMGDYDRALEYHLKDLAITEKVLGMEHPNTATSYNNIGSVYEDMGDYDRALEYYEKAVKTLEKVLGTEHPDTATSYNNIGLLYTRMGDYNRALEYHEKAVKIREKVLGTEHPDTAVSYNNIGGVYKDMGDYDRALEYYEKAVIIREKVLGTKHPDTATSYNNIGGVYKDMGDYDRALEYYEKSVIIREKVLGTKHPDTATTYNNIGLLYRQIGDYDRALEYYLKVMAIFEKIFGTEHPSTAVSYNNIGGVYKDMGDYDRALEYYLKDLAITEKVLGTGHPDTATTYNNIGLLYKRMGDYDRALEYYLKALAISEKGLGTEHLSTAVSYNNIGVFYANRGDFSKALEYLEKALKIFEEKLGTEHPNTKQTKQDVDYVKSNL